MALELRYKPDLLMTNKLICEYEQALEPIWIICIKIGLFFPSNHLFIVGVHGILFGPFFWLFSSVRLLNSLMFTVLHPLARVHQAMTRTLSTGLPLPSSGVCSQDQHGRGPARKLKAKTWELTAARSLSTGRKLFSTEQDERPGRDSVVESLPSLWIHLLY